MTDQQRVHIEQDLLLGSDLLLGAFAHGERLRFAARTILAKATEHLVLETIPKMIAAGEAKSSLIATFDLKDLGKAG